MPRRRPAAFLGYFLGRQEVTRESQRSWRRNGPRSKKPRPIPGIENRPAAKRLMSLLPVKRSGKRCLKPPCQTKPDEHRDPEGDLRDGADQYADAGAYACAEGVVQGGLAESVADDGADERAEQHSRDAEEHADQQVQRGAEDRRASCAETASTLGGGEEIKYLGEKHQDRKAQQGTEADPDEIVQPGHQQHAGQHDGRAGQRRQEGAGQSNQHQQPGQHPGADHEGVDRQTFQTSAPGQNRHYSLTFFDAPSTTLRTSQWLSLNRFLPTPRPSWPKPSTI